MTVRDATVTGTDITVSFDDIREQVTLYARSSHLTLTLREWIALLEQGGDLRARARPYTSF